jgi:two-component system response regulator AtoC
MNLAIDDGMMQSGITEGLEPTWAETVDDILERLGPSDVPVLIQGATGAGKEVVARAIHARSSRSSNPFLKINCAALPAELAESELFGYERGAFTGAFQTNPGKFELANGGTVLLDEIGDMEFRLQAKLLQVLQDQEYMPLGARKTRKVNVRLIAATHRDLQGMIAEGRFRADLYYRLDVIKILVPSLSQRKNEILKLAQVLLERHTPAGTQLPELTPEFQRAALTYDWPGNVRELENVIRRLVVYRNADALAQELFRSADMKTRGEGLAVVGEDAAESEILRKKPAGAMLDQIRREREADEVRIFMNALEATRWNRKKAASHLRIEYKAFLYRMKKLGIHDEIACAS